MSDDVAGVLFRHRERLKEIASVLSRYGFARLADHAAEAGEPSIAGRIFTRTADPGLASLSAGQRLRRALSELGTTWIQLGQMLSLRPDLVGPDVAAELAQLQADVPADPPGSAEQTIKTDLGRTPLKRSARLKLRRWHQHQLRRPIARCCRTAPR
jgi:ubiquinone biosynthesis protein